MLCLLYEAYMSFQTSLASCFPFYVLILIKFYPGSIPHPPPPSQDEVLLCNSGWSGRDYVDNPSFKLTTELLFQHVRQLQVNILTPSLNFFPVGCEETLKSLAGESSCCLIQKSSGHVQFHVMGTRNWLCQSRCLLILRHMHLWCLVGESCLR